MEKILFFILLLLFGLTIHNFKGLYLPSIIKSKANMTEQLCTSSFGNRLATVYMIYFYVADVFTPCVGSSVLSALAFPFATLSFPLHVAMRRWQVAHREVWCNRGCSGRQSSACPLAPPLLVRQMAPALSTVFTLRRKGATLTTTLCSSYRWLFSLTEIPLRVEIVYRLSLTFLKRESAERKMGIAYGLWIEIFGKIIITVTMGLLVVSVLKGHPTLVLDRPPNDPTLKPYCYIIHNHVLWFSWSTTTGMVDHIPSLVSSCVFPPSLNWLKSLTVSWFVFQVMADPWCKQLRDC